MAGEGLSCRKDHDEGCGGDPGIVDAEGDLREQVRSAGALINLIEAQKQQKDRYGGGEHAPEVP